MKHWEAPTYLFIKPKGHPEDVLVLDAGSSRTCAWHGLEHHPARSYMAYSLKLPVTVLPFLCVQTVNYTNNLQSNHCQFAVKYCLLLIFYTKMKFSKNPSKEPRYIGECGTRNGRSKRLSRHLMPECLCSSAARMASIENRLQPSPFLEQKNIRYQPSMPVHKKPNQTQRRKKKLNAI